MTTIFNFPWLINTLTFNQDVIAVGFPNGTITLFNLKLSQVVQSWDGHHGGIAELVFLSDGSLVSGSWDGFVKRWDLETGQNEKLAPKELWARNLGGGSVNSLTELPRGRVAAACSDDTVCVLDLGTGLLPLQGGVCRGHTSCVFTVISLGVVGDRAGSFASGSNDKTIRVWANDGTLTRVVEVGSTVRSLSLSPCEGMVVAGCRDGSVRLFRLPEWDAVWSVNVHTEWGRSLFFSPDGRFLASASHNRLVKILSPETGAVLRTLEGHTDWVRSVLFSHDGFSVISGSDDKTVRVWRLVEQDDRIASLLSGRTSSDLTYQGADVFKQLFTIIRTKLIEF